MVSWSGHIYIHNTKLTVNRKEADENNNIQLRIETTEQISCDNFHPSIIIVSGLFELSHLLLCRCF